ncbi:unnamed protein product [Diamesa hyperborea]
MYSKLAVNLLMLCSITSAVLSATVPKKATEMADQMGKEFSILQKVYDDCHDKSDFTGCLKGKAVMAISRAIEQDQIQLIDGVSLVKQENVIIDDKPLFTDARTLNDLSVVDRALLQNMEKFLKTHTVKLDLNEARGKGKKQYKYVIAAMLTAMGIAGPLGLKALAAIAGKALVISKVALTIAGIIALKKIFTKDHHEETSFQVHAGSDHNRRNAYLKMKGAANQVVDPYRYYYEQQMQNQ